MYFQAMKESINLFLKVNETPVKFSKIYKEIEKVIENTDDSHEDICINVNVLVCKPITSLPVTINLTPYDERF